MSLQQIIFHVKTFFLRKDGASGIEYAVIAAMVAVVLAGFVTPISTEVTDIMNKIKTAITQ
ncbi:Flp family type IVb pilin [Pseudomonas sp. GD03858]|uniref:Flp family type IVb pilin n=1 Tax=unclassified Pseudomonas TaxID=196821 RepID=UPI0024481AAD|nr:MULTISPECIES: Flp family type IVb pilin [unclassified Pseudomonas]MDH0649105.1 Flp family type IVb pilin [Pseudomonas sp. GD03867]MDH0663233.1 Flp family type IVb pilin [Pseudomonas sp. GD03858]